MVVYTVLAAGPVYGHILARLRAGLRNVRKPPVSIFPDVAHGFPYVVRRYGWLNILTPPPIGILPFG